MRWEGKERERVCVSKKEELRERERWKGRRGERERKIWKGRGGDREREQTRTSLAIEQPTIGNLFLVTLCPIIIAHY